MPLCRLSSLSLWSLTLVVGACSSSAQQPFDASLNPSDASLNPSDAAISIDGRDAPIDGAPFMQTHRLALGGLHSCVVRTTGELRCWGHNQDGELGDGTLINRPTPTTVLGGSYVQASGGNYFTCGLTAAGAVTCWGRNADGQLGDGTNLSRGTPAPVQGLQSGVLQIVAGPASACALMADHTVRCWGNNVYGQLGDNTQLPRLAPVTVAGLRNVASIAVGATHTCARLTDGALKCWGWAYHGLLGNGEGAIGTIRLAPVDVVSLGTPTAAVAGANSTCTPLATGRLQCWGRNQYSQLGDGSTVENSLPVLAIVADVASVAVGAVNACAVNASHVVSCWGDNSEGSVGNGTRGPGVVQATPVVVAGLPSDVVEIDAGQQHVCALTASDRLFCWGYNVFGQIGDGTTNTDRSSAIEIIGM